MKRPASRTSALRLVTGGLGLGLATAAFGVLAVAAAGSAACRALLPRGAGALRPSGA